MFDLRVYNTEFIIDGVSPTAVVETYIAFTNLGRLRVKPLGDAYGRPNAIIPDRLGLTTDESGNVLTSNEKPAVPLSRNAHVLAQFENTLTSLVLAGMVDIDPTKSYMAGQFGKLNRFAKDRSMVRQVQFDLATKTATMNAFIALSAYQNPRELAHTWGSDSPNSFVNQANALMGQGHSCCSAFRHLLSHSGWMQPRSMTFAEPATSSAASTASTEPTAGDKRPKGHYTKDGSEYVTAAAHKKRCDHLEKMLDQEKTSNTKNKADAERRIRDARRDRGDWNRGREDWGRDSYDNRGGGSSRGGSAPRGGSQRG